MNNEPKHERQRLDRDGYAAPVQDRLIGRTAAFGAANLGSSPSPEATPLPTWPIVRWTHYGRWADDGSKVYASSPWVAKGYWDMPIYP